MGIESVQDYFERVVPARLEGDPESAQSIGATYQFHVTGDNGGDWVIDFKAPQVRNETDDGADCTVTVSDADFLGILNGSINPVQAFMMGKIKIGGNMSLAMKLQQVLKT